MSHGGKRAGAGRKPRPEGRKVPISIRLDAELVEYLATHADRTAAIESALRRSTGFRNWKREQESKR